MVYSSESYNAVSRKGWKGSQKALGYSGPPMDVSAGSGDGQ